MKSFSASIAYLLCFVLTLCSALSTAGSRTLVILDDDQKSTYSTFISDLQARGFEISIQSPKSTTLNLFAYEETSYDHVILFPTKSKGLGPNLQSSTLLQYASKGGNLLIFLDSSADGTTPASIVELASQVDITLAPKGSIVVDHFSPAHGSGNNAHDSILVSLPSLPSNVRNYFISGGSTGKVLFKGQGMILGDSPLVQPILKAPRTAYSYDAKESAEYADDDGVFAAGSQLVLVAGVQARNNARITFVGGAELVSDAAFTAKDGGDSLANGVFAKDVSAWTFQETGVLKVDKIEHWGVEKGPNVLNGDIYRVKSDVTYSIAISEYSYNKWTPFALPPNDALQLEFRMLDPYYRVALAPNSTSGVFTKTFHTPDQHGIFTFSVNYKRPFMSSIHEKAAVTVRHFAHNEWTRSWGISGSWVWIAGIWVVVAGWIAFVALWLWSVPMETVKVAGKKL